MINMPEMRGGKADFRPRGAQAMRICSLIRATGRLLDPASDLPRGLFIWCVASAMPVIRTSSVQASASVS